MTVVGVGLVTAALLAAAGASPADEAPATPESEPWLWVIEGRPKTYIRGSLPIAFGKWEDLPAIVRAAYESADVLVVGLDASPGGVMVAMAKTMLPEGKLLQDAIPEEMYVRVEKAARAHDVPVSLFARMRPWAVGMQLGALKFTRMGSGRQSTAFLLQQKARAAGIPVVALETVGEMLDVYDGLSTELQTAFLGRCLDRLENQAEEGDDLGKRMIKAYREGDAKKLVTLSYEGYDLTNPTDHAVNQRLVKRFPVLARRLLEKTASDEDATYFVDMSILPCLEKPGFLGALRGEGKVVRRITPD